MSVKPQTHNPSREMDIDGNQFCDCGDYYPCPTVILTDLIAELRRYPAGDLLDMSDRYEARLRRFAMNDKIWIDEAWQLPDDLADRVRQGNYADAWKLEIERTAQMRAILQDLIAELRGDTGICDDVGVKEYTDRAEARLKEVQGE